MYKRQLAFNPQVASELWVADAASDSLFVFQMGADDAVVSQRRLKDRAQYHYMAQPSAISFDALGQFATCQESLNSYDGKMLPNFFMGSQPCLEPRLRP